MFPEAKPRGTLKSRGNNSLFPEGPVIKCFVIPPDSKIEKAPKKIICLRPLHTLAAFAKLSGCQTATCSIEKSRYQSFSSQLTKNIDSTKVALASSNA